MVFRDLTQWESLPEETRERFISEWDIYSSEGYWTELFKQAVEELRHLLAGDMRVKNIYVANNHGRLEITVVTVGGPLPLPGFDERFRRTYRGLAVRQTVA
jgi:hypothetical protein